MGPQSVTEQGPARPALTCASTLQSRAPTVRWARGKSSNTCSPVTTPSPEPVPPSLCPGVSPRGHHHPCGRDAYGPALQMRKRGQRGCSHEPGLGSDQGPELGSVPDPGDGQREGDAASLSLPAPTGSRTHRGHRTAESPSPRRVGAAVQRGAGSLHPCRPAGRAAWSPGAQRGPQVPAQGSTEGRDREETG